MDSGKTDTPVLITNISFSKFYWIFLLTTNLILASFPKLFRKRNQRFPSLCSCFTCSAYIFQLFGSYGLPYTLENLVELVLKLEEEIITPSCNGFREISNLNLKKYAVQAVPKYIAGNAGRQSAC